MSTNESKQKTQWLPMILVAAICSGASVGGFYLLSKKDDAASKAKVEEVVVAPKPIFVKVAPFTVNLNSERSSRLLYTGISLRVGDKETADFINEYMPQLRSKLLVMIADLKVEDLATPEGKNALKANILALFDQPFATPQPKLKVDEVLFNEFIVQ
ncbi:flagellar basal body-associated FliL family protein [Pseudomonas sp. PLMAX]|jgi:flagellar FliL protein|uniref:flagellar basal body-associated FliL family protein n=1 Tax=Pseudomonas sp. PLMAX TaxID=2201998 RepID=UPI0038B6F523